MKPRRRASYFYSKSSYTHSHSAHTHSAHTHTHSAHTHTHNLFSSYNDCIPNLSGQSSKANLAHQQKVFAIVTVFYYCILIIAQFSSVDLLPLPIIMPFNSFYAKVVFCTTRIFLPHQYRNPLLALQNNQQTHQYSSTALWYSNIMEWF